MGSSGYFFSVLDYKEMYTQGYSRDRMREIFLNRQKMIKKISLEEKSGGGGGTIV